ncbi:31197_t:CDS:2, partial [Gigaspora margarita]
IQYEIYFSFVAFERWGFYSYDTAILENYKHANKDDAHRVFFYRTLQVLADDPNRRQEVRKVAKSSKASDLKKVKELWERPNSWMRELTNSAKEGEKTQAALQAFHQKKKEEIPISEQQKYAPSF